MTLRLGALHDALLNPGDPDLARKAAEELAGYDDRLSRIERDLAILKWMVGTTVALTLGLLWLVLRLSETVAAVAGKLGV
jgi:hypothetical protein